ncbi:hypothetical protein [Nocardia goodfellowii]|uniref:Uncharacterized protein n=1 Tax=Nocardia goodfellowii TaxID=882446 RepID=A0ABS4QI88_9NOCA|nr:hypothetical protein [Nocardia goodfellowii]MBP2191416.1 hypothetical protein [Nocardia goodfellowii]
MNIEVVDVAGGAGVIDVRGDCGSHGQYGQSLLYLGGAAAGLDTADFAGSIGRLVMRAPQRAPRPEQLQALRHLTTDGYDNGNLAEILAPLLALMAHGRYELRSPEPVTKRIAEGFQAWYSSQEWGVSGPQPDEPSGIYPLEDWLTPTEQWPPTDTETVERYRTAIRRGARPVVITLRAGAENLWSGFVLDGHHKLAAYRAEELAPTVLRIARVGAPPITAEEVRDHFPRAAEHPEMKWAMAALERRDQRPFEQPDQPYRDR